MVSFSPTQTKQIKLKGLNTYTDVLVFFKLRWSKEKFTEFEKK